MSVRKYVTPIKEKAIKKMGRHAGVSPVALLMPRHTDGLTVSDPLFLTKNFTECQSVKTKSNGKLPKYK